MVEAGGTPVPPRLCWCWRLSLSPAKISLAETPIQDSSHVRRGDTGTLPELQYKMPPLRPNPSIKMLSPLLGSFHHWHVGQREARGTPGSAPSPLTTLMVTHTSSLPQARLMLSRPSRTHCILEEGLAQRNIWTKPFGRYHFPCFQPSECKREKLGHEPRPSVQV